jgi:hypothetical protein
MASQKATIPEARAIALQVHAIDQIPDSLSFLSDEAIKASHQETCKKS